MNSSVIAIDVYRGCPPAQAGLAAFRGQSLFISGFVAFELVQGCRSGEDMRRMERVMRPFAVEWPSSVAIANALNDFGRLSLSHNVSIFDCLIAHTALERGATLYTFNLRHFAHFPGLDARAPYAR